MYKKIIGSFDKNTFDERVFNISALIGFVITFVSLIINLLNHYPFLFNLIIGLLSLAFLGMYFLSRFRKKSEKLKIPFIIVFSLCNINAWFYTEGIMGSTTGLIIFSIIGSPFLVKKNQKYIFGFIFANTLILILIHWFFPELITPYPNYTARFLDNSAVLLFVILISAYTMFIFRKLYENEKQIIENQKKELELQKIELADKNGKLIELNQFKEMMTGMVIHDLKNPLSTIIGVSNQNFSEKNMFSIRQSGKQMLNLVLNILDVQRLENAQMSLNKEEISVSVLLKSALEDILILIKEKNIEIEIKGNSQSMVLVDKELIKRVFVNILSNAIKYSDNNAKIELLFEQNSENKEIKVTITDFGQGIAEDKIAKVFDKFSQINSINTSSMRSTGIGLAFCKLVMQAHGSEIGVHSKLGEYTAFWFTLAKANLVLNPLQVFDFAHLKRKKYIFSLNEKEYIQTFLNLLVNFRSYETGKIIPVLQQIDEHFSTNIFEWKQDLENAVYSNNEQNFLELLKV